MPAARFFEREGDRLYHGLVEGFRGVQFGGPLPCARGETRAVVVSVGALGSFPESRPVGMPCVALCTLYLMEGPREHLLSHKLTSAGAPVAELLAGVQRLLDIYQDKGYALKATLIPGGSSSHKATLTPVGSSAGSSAGGLGSSFEVRLEGPANLWSLQARGWYSAELPSPCAVSESVLSAVTCCRCFRLP